VLGKQYATGWIEKKKKKEKKKNFMTCMKLYVINKDIDKNGDIERRWGMG
jgi:hypothetical protein